MDESNITCQRCGFRHPASRSCEEAKRLADEAQSKQFLCVQCGELTANCKCDSVGKMFETELAWRQKVIAKIDAIERKLDQVLELLAHPLVVVRSSCSFRNSYGQCKLGEGHDGLHQLTSDLDGNLPKP